MSAEEMKAKVQAAYMQAIAQTNMTRSRRSGLHNLFRDLRLYGREAGVDFATTHIGEIVQEAVENASCKAHMMTIPMYQSGSAAIEGIASALREGTGLIVDVKGSTVTLAWARTEPSLL